MSKNIPRLLLLAVLMLAAGQPAKAAAESEVPGRAHPERAQVVPQAPLHDDTYDLLGTVVACFGPGDPACLWESDCINGTCYVPKGRCVSVKPNSANVGLITARRVSLDLGAGASVVLGWAQEPVVYHPVTSNPIGPGPLPVLVSDIADNPVYRAWNADPVDTQGNIVVHISGCEVSNGHIYLIQSIDAGADVDNEANYSPPLSLPTTLLFGDSSSGAASGPAWPPERTANFVDVIVEVLAFRAQHLAPATWLKILPGDGPFDPSAITLVGDVFATVLAFQGQSYPGLAPLDCP